MIQRESTSAVRPSSTALPRKVADLEGSACDYREANHARRAIGVNPHHLIIHPHPPILFIGMGVIADKLRALGLTVAAWSGRNDTPEVGRMCACVDVHAVVLCGLPDDADTTALRRIISQYSRNTRKATPSTMASRADAVRIATEVKAKHVRI